MNRVYVLDENISAGLRERLPKYCINARYLYFLCGKKPTYGHTDDVLLNCAKEKGFTIITLDKGLALLAAMQNVPIIYKTKHRYFLLEGMKSIHESEFGEMYEPTSSEEHHAILAERGWKP